MKKVYNKVCDYNELLRWLQIGNGSINDDLSDNSQHALSIIDAHINKYSLMVSFSCLLGIVGAIAFIYDFIHRMSYLNMLVPAVVLLFSSYMIYSGLKNLIYIALHPREYLIFKLTKNIA